MRECSDIVKKRGSFRLFGVFCVRAAIVLALTFWVQGDWLQDSSGAAHAAVRYTKKIEKVPGFRFENFVYAWDKVELDVVNTTSGAKQFGGTMIFLDRRGKPIARAALLPKKVPGLKSERYTAYFVEGSGEAARHSASIIWDFGTR